MTLTAEVQEQLLVFFKLLANAQRLRIAGALALAPLPADRLVQTTGIGDADLRRHLKLLTDAGLVSVQADGAFVLDERALEVKARQVLAGQRQVAEASANATDGFERKVLRDYLDSSGRVKVLPSQGKKRAVVLQYVNRAFSPGVKYSEKEINAALSRFHEDTATLRRSLVDSGLMARDHGVYWQVEAEQTETTNGD